MRYSFRCLTGVFLGALLFASGHADAQFNETLKYTASDAAGGDRLGWSVAISGNTAIVGALLDRDAGTYSGSAYLFDTITGNELFKLTASDAAALDQFGQSVAVSGNTAVVGSYLDDDDGSNSGSAYVFDTTSGNELFKLTASDASVGAQFGWSIAINDHFAVIGAPLDHDDVTSHGSAYVFDTTTGLELFKLTASDAATQDQFGYSVAVSGDTVVIGSFLDDDAGSRSGSAYVFDLATGNELFKLTASDAAAGDLFGNSVALRGNTIIVGSPLDDDGFSDSGSVYVFDKLTGNELYKVTASDAAVDDRFGASVALSGSTMLIGASYNEGSGPSRSGGRTSSTP